jgi:2'-5' RNA ligase
LSARLFAAVDIAPEDAQALAGWAKEVVGDDPGLRLVPPDRIHLTLAFLGHRALDEVEPLAALVAAAGADPPPITLRTAGALWLSPRRPHVLTVAIDDEGGGLEALHDRLWTALEARGFERERRRFRPHLTVARVRHGWTAPSRRLPPPPERALQATALTLYRSWLGGGPARYEAIVRTPLAAG